MATTTRTVGQIITDLGGLYQSPSPAEIIQDEIEEIEHYVASCQKYLDTNARETVTWSDGSESQISRQTYEDGVQRATILVPILKRALARLGK